MSRGVTISLYLINGDPSGLICAYLSNWTGQAIKIPRNILDKAKSRPEVNRIGVYFLFGYNDDSPDERIVYIGESDNIYDRLVQHTKDENKSFWTEAIAFTSKDDNLTKGHVKYLEYELIKQAKLNAKFTIHNKNDSSKTSLPEMAISDMDTFLDNIKVVLPAIGYELLEQPKNLKESKKIYFKLEIAGLKAKGFLSNNGFVVMKGSKVSFEIKDSLSTSYKKLKDNLIEKDILNKEGNHYIFLKDYEFSSPSTAAAVIVGYAINGRISWKDEKGKTLKQHEDESLEEM